MYLFLKQMVARPPHGVPQLACFAWRSILKLIPYQDLWGGLILSSARRALRCETHCHLFSQARVIGVHPLLEFFKELNEYSSAQEPGCEQVHPTRGRGARERTPRSRNFKEGPHTSAGGCTSVSCVLLGDTDHRALVVAVQWGLELGLRYHGNLVPSIISRL